jgi:hypothetical protein
MVLLNSKVPPSSATLIGAYCRDPLALDQSIGEVAFAGSGIVGVGATYIHAAKITQTVCAGIYVVHGLPVYKT